MLENIRKIVYLTCGERYENMIIIAVTQLKRLRKTGKNQRALFLNTLDVSRVKPLKNGHYPDRNPAVHLGVWDLFVF